VQTSYVFMVTMVIKVRTVQAVCGLFTLPIKMSAMVTVGHRQTLFFLCQIISLFTICMGII